MYYDAIKGDHGLPHDPFKSIVVPRPIGWISSISETGVLNLAPYSFFNGVSSIPPMVMYSSDGRKDSVVNVEATGEFTCSLVGFSEKDAMNESSNALPADMSEFEQAGIAYEESYFVKPPRVANCMAALECKYVDTYRVPDMNGNITQNHVIIGQLVGVYIHDDLLKDGLIDLTRARPLARLGYMEYGTLGDIFVMNRPDGAPRP